MEDGTISVGLRVRNLKDGKMARRARRKVNLRVVLSGSGIPSLSRSMDPIPVANLLPLPLGKGETIHSAAK